jgi:tetratricopeptide (TPR) repeat protein
MAYVAAGQFRPAITKLEAALHGEPKSALFLGYLVRAYAGTTDQLYQQLAERGKQSPEAHLALAQAYAATGDRTEAAEEYRAAAAVNPKLPGVHGALGGIYVDLGEFAKAEEAFRKELELSPDSADNQFHLGMVLSELGRADDALPYLERAASRLSSNAESFFYLGKVHFDLGHLAEAEEALRKALEGPLSLVRLRSAHYQLWMTYRKLEKPEQAAKHLQMFKQIEAELAAARKKDTAK